MRIRGRQIPWLEVLVGASVALTLMTGYRSDLGVGVGEVGIMLALLVGLARGVGVSRMKDSTDLWRMPAWLLAYALLLLLPLTLINVFLADLPGASLRDWFAYFLCFGFIFSLYYGKVDLVLAGRFFLYCVIAVMVGQFLFGGEAAWYSARFTAGAKNPNQLALYCVTGILVASTVVRDPLLKWGAIFLFIFFGLKSGSDAFMATLAVVPFIISIIYFVPRRSILSVGFLLMLSGLALLLMFQDDLLAWAGLEWEGADEGGLRLVLYQNGLRAWMDSVSAFLIGNGAGNFSGLGGPFQMGEAHNTPIDFLSIGGCIGLLLIYLFPVKFLVRAYAAREILVSSFIVALVVFSFFHFVARHPVWWFSLYVACWVLSRPPAASERVV